jgi:hypothetical protein
LAAIGFEDGAAGLGRQPRAAKCPPCALPRGWTAYRDAFEDPLGELLLAKRRAKLMIYSEEREVIQQWTPEAPTEAAALPIGVTLPLLQVAAPAPAWLCR